MNPVLSRKKLELFQALSRKHGLEDERFRVDLERRSGPARLSFTQEGLWLLHQLDPADPAYNEHFALRLTGRVDEGALERSINHVVARHQVLRSTFSAVDGIPMQTPVPEQFIPLEIEDLSSIPEADRLRVGTEIARAEARKPFDLNKGPLLRTRLIRLRDCESLLLLTIHHIAIDGESYAIFLREVSSAYQAYATSAALEVPDLPVQYSDFARWQRHERVELHNEPGIKYWCDQLVDAPAMALVVQTGSGSAESAGKISVPIDPGLTRQIEKVAQQQGVTVFMVWIAALTTLLSRYSGRNDVVIGTPISLRSHSSLKEVIGPFVNTVALRLRLDAQSSFGELLSETRSTCTEAFAHQEVPFEYVVQALSANPSHTARQPFQTSFVVQNAPVLALAGLQVELIDVPNGSAKYDLSVSVRTLGKVSELTFQYRSTVFDDEAIRGMAGHLLTLLRGALQNVDTRVAGLPLLTAIERKQLIDWSHNEFAFPQSQCLHALFEQQVQLSPDVVAAACGDDQLSFTQLNKRSNQLARVLRAKGVGPDARVGICLERSLEMIVAILAVLKAGAAYVPLDPQYPSERLEYILQDAGTELVIASRDTDSKLPGTGTHVLVDRDTLLIAQQSEHSFESGALPQNLAYVIYTSGSTGRPKGVAIEHQSVNNLWGALRRMIYADQERNLKVGINAPFAFDAAVKQWITLLGGHTICVIPQEIRSNPEDLVRYCREQEIECLDVTPSQLSALITQGLIGFTKLRLLLIGGEPISASQWKELRGHSQVQSFNVYGPTETTVDAAVCLIQNSEFPSIGRAITNTQVYILDEEMELVPVGVAGELCIGGAGLARGYLNQPGRTGERFVPNGWGGAGSRLYRSGDVVRWRADGQLEFLGRKDQQVKVRGYRIELGEIEAALQEHEEVEQGVAGVVGEEGDKRLVAWVVGREGRGEVSSVKLREYLRGRLPEYMVPAAIVGVERMPLTANGKVDRKALPEPEWKGVEGGGEESRRASEVEELIGGIWGEVLGVEQVGLGRNFFELGGHSLLATQVMSRVRKVFGVEVGLRALFQEPTVEGLAVEVERALGRRSAETNVPLVKRRDERARLSFAQERLWFLDQLEPGSVSYHIPAAVRLKGELNVEALEQSLQKLVERHGSLRTHFEEIEGEPVQVVEEAREIKLGIRRVGSEEELQKELEDFVRERFDLARGPLLRVRLWEMEGQDHVVGMSLHHIVADGWSTGILTRELSQLYEARCEGREAELKELPVQYTDYAMWQREWLSGGVLEGEMEYWKEQVRGYSGVVELPADGARGREAGAGGGSGVGWRGEEQAGGLRRFSRGEGVTLFMTLLGGLAALLYRYTGQKDLVVGTPVANRNRVETEGVIGLFVNTLALRVRVEAGESFRELLEQVRERALEGYMHQDVPFEKLVEELRPERELSRSPLVQVVLALQNTPERVLELPGLQWERWGVETGSAKFDVSVEVSPSGEGLSLSWQYRADLFEAGSVERMAEHFERVLQGGVEEAERRVGELPMLSGSERRQLLEEWKGCDAEYPQRCVHELFEEQAEKTPEAIAVEYEGQRLSYGELNRRGNRLGHYLRKLGAGPEARVGICVERSLDMVVGLLGILKAGAAYVPLDITYPRERLSYMLKDSGVEVLIGTDQARQYCAGGQFVYVDIEQDKEAIDKQGCDNPWNQSTSGTLAYLLYTSGSTGVPKAVGIEHRSIVRLVRNTNYFEVKEQEVFLQLAPISFDASTFEIWGCLLNGGRLVLHPQQTPSLEALGEYIERSGITTLWLTAGLFHQMVEGPVEKLRGIRQLLAGGDVLNPEQVRRASAALPRTKLINGYGPTENTTFT